MFDKDELIHLIEENVKLREINSRLTNEVKDLSLLDDEQRIYIKNLEQQITKLTLKIEEESYKKQLEFVNIECIIRDLKNDSKIKFLLDNQGLLGSIKGKINDLICLLHEFEQIKEETE